jgi:hypothetical protein
MKYQTNRCPNKEESSRKDAKARRYNNIEFFAPLRLCVRSDSLPTCEVLRSPRCEPIATH